MFIHRGAVLSRLPMLYRLASSPVNDHDAGRKNRLDCSHKCITKSWLSHDLRPKWLSRIGNNFIFVVDKQSHCVLTGEVVNLNNQPIKILVLNFPYAPLIQTQHHMDLLINASSFVMLYLNKLQMKRIFCSTHILFYSQHKQFRGFNMYIQMYLKHCDTLTSHSVKSVVLYFLNIPIFNE